MANSKIGGEESNCYGLTGDRGNVGLSKSNMTGAMLCDLAEPSEEALVPEVSKAEAAEAARLQRNRLLGSAAAVLLAFGFGGFVPSYYVGFMQGQWFFDGVHKRNFPPATEAAAKYGVEWRVLVLIHAITALLWTVMGAVQVATGATGKPGGKRKAYHRISGYFAGFLALLVVIEAVVLQCHKELSGDYIAIMSNAALILINLVAGIRYARSKQYNLHKTAMAWTCAWTGAPGMTRVTAYFLMIVFGGCKLETLCFLTWGAGAIIMASICPPAVLLKEVRTRMFMFNVFFVLLSMTGEALTSVSQIKNRGWCEPL
jgi:hypothetical protein